MKILLTSGGTAVPIDNVRSIKNFSSGSFGAKLAKHFLLAGDTVTHLHAVDAPTPFEFKVDLLKPHQDYVSMLDALQEFSKQYMKHYIEEKFTTFDGYANKVDTLISHMNYDIVVLCAAVSDYGVDKVDGKISSSGQISIELNPLPKIINNVRKKFDGTLVGFKLLSNVSEDELHKAAWNQIYESGSNIVIANMLEDIQTNKKQMFFVKPDYAMRMKGSSDECAKLVAHLARLR